MRGFHILHFLLVIDKNNITWILSGDIHTVLILIRNI